MRTLLTLSMLLLLAAALAACSDGDGQDPPAPSPDAETLGDDPDDTGEAEDDGEVAVDGEADPGDDGEPSDDAEAGDADAGDESDIGASETEGEGIESGEETEEGTLVARIDSGGLPFELSASAEEGQVCAHFIAGEGEDERCDWPVDPDEGLVAEVLTVDGMQSVFAVVSDDVATVEVVGVADSTTELEVLDVGDDARVAGAPPVDAEAVTVIALDDSGDEVARVDL